MTKQALIEFLALKMGLPKNFTGRFLDTAMEKIGVEVIRSRRFSYPKFGTWTVRTRKARNIQNPQTHEIMRLPFTTTIGFRPARELKARIPTKKKQRAA